MRPLLLALTMLLVQTPPEPPPMRVIRGVVTSIGASDAVTDAEISVAIDKSDLDTVIAAFKYNQKFPMRTLSDGTGHFTFGGIVPGKFTITVQRDGFFANSPDAKGNFRDSVSVTFSSAISSQRWRRTGAVLMFSRLTGPILPFRLDV